MQMQMQEKNVGDRKETVASSQNALTFDLKGLQNTSTPGFFFPGFTEMVELFKRSLSRPDRGGASP